MPTTTHTKNTILKGLTGRNDSIAYSVYVGLSSTAPNVDGTNVTEPTGGGYARVLVGIYNQSGTHKFGEPENDEIKNDEFIYFPESTGSWGDTLTHFVLYSAETGGNLLAYGLLKSGSQATPITVDTEKTVVMFRPRTLVISIEDEA